MIDDAIKDLEGWNGRTFKLEGNGFFTRENADMAEIRKAYQAKQSTPKGSYYVFVLKSADAGTEDGDTKTHGVQGDMPRGQQFGYVFSDRISDMSWLLAHELGHGVFTLRHLNDANYAGKSSLGRLQNLMDYTRSTALAAFQWNTIFNPAILTGLDGDDASKAVATSKYVEYFTEKITTFERNYTGVKFVSVSHSNVYNGIAFNVDKNEIHGESFGSGEIAHSLILKYKIGKETKVLTISQLSESLKENITLAKKDWLKPTLSETGKLYIDTLIGIIKVQLLARNEIKKVRVIFPLKTLPLNNGGQKYVDRDWAITGASTTFGADRSKRTRKHAGIDLYTNRTEAIYSIADGVVLEKKLFYANTYQVTVLHTLNDGVKYIVRYGEMDVTSINVSVGQIIKQGDFIGRTGFLNKNGQPSVTINGETIYMLHFEVYSCSMGENLSTPLTVSSYNRQNHLRAKIKTTCDYLSRRPQKPKAKFLGHTHTKTAFKRSSKTL